MSNLIQPGALLQNRYRVTEQIGHGGMGAVYIATDERFRSTVAIKQTLFDDPALSKAFEREAHLLNHLRHAALPKVSDHFIEGAGQFLVMEYIEGYDFAELLQQRNGAFPLADVLAWADQLLDALEYLHSHEPAVVHRDIKPQNVKRTPRGQIVLLDFGLAKGLPAQAHTNANASVFGYSRNYAPLEQIQGTGTDLRSDLYSLGATLYHLLTGMVPVDALTRAAALVNNQPDPLRPAHLAHAQVPSEVSDVIRRAMSQNAARRPRTAAEMRAALRHAKNSAGAHHPFQALEDAARAEQEHPAFRDTIVSTSLSSTDSQPAHPATRRAARPTSAPSQDPTLIGETTIVEPPSSSAQRPARRPPMKDGASSPDASQPPRKSHRLLILAVIGLLVASASVPVLLSRGSEADTINPAGARIETTPGALDGSQPAATDAAPIGVTSPAISATENTSVPTQTTVARPAGEPASNTNTHPAPNNAAEATGGNGADASGSDGVANSSSTNGASGHPGLVINAPAPAAYPTPVPVDNGAAEEAARRAEESRRMQERERAPYPEEEQRRPPPEGFRPPPPDGRRPFPRQPPRFP